MLICDQYIAIRAISGNLPEELRGEHLSIASSHYWLLLRAAAKLRDPHPGIMGRLSRLIAGLSPAAQAELVIPSSDIIEVLDFREYARASAGAAHQFGLKWLVADLVGSALHYRVPLCFSREGNIPPAIKNNNKLLRVRYMVAGSS
ncbi:MAG: hypothetical protein OXN95_02040 [bacterium]|nr:hypothetical protein [bacterium]